MEMQLYPPGDPPFDDSISCDDTHWCAALTIDSLECTPGHGRATPNARSRSISRSSRRNGVPTGAPAPQDATIAT